jgi:hypothetical protein
VGPAVRQIFIHTSCGEKYWTKAGILYHSITTYGRTAYPIRWEIQGLRWNGKEMILASSRTVRQQPSLAAKMTATTATRESA